MKLITAEMLDELVGKAGEATRLRMNFNIHEQLSDPVQRLFIAAKPSSYFRPHRHPGKSEFAIVCRGRFDVLIFDETGLLTRRVSIGPQQNAFGLEIPADAWHTWIPRDEASVFFEVKQGPYDPATSMEFASWSPAEGSPEVAAFQARLLKLTIGEKAC